MSADLKVVSVPGDVAQVVASFTQLLADRDIEVFATIDHGAGAEKAGLDLGDEVVVIFGNPTVGTRLMQADRRAGLDLPLRVLIWSEAGRTSVAYRDPHDLAHEYELASAAPVLDALAGLLEQLVNSVA